MTTLSDFAQIWNQRILDQLVIISKQLDQLTSGQESQTAAILNSANAELTVLQAIQFLLTPSPTPAAKLVITLESATQLNEKGDNPMAKAAKFGKFRINILDNGTAQYNLSIVDTANLATTLEAGTPAPVPTFDNPGVVATPAADGMSGIISPATPPVLVSGATLTVTASQPTLGPVSGTYNPVNIVAGPAGSFVVAVQ